MQVGDFQVWQMVPSDKPTLKSQNFDNRDIEKMEAAFHSAIASACVMRVIATNSTGVITWDCYKEKRPSYKSQD